MSPAWGLRLGNKLDCQAYVVVATRVAVQGQEAGFQMHQLLLPYLGPTDIGTIVFSPSLT